MPTQHLNDDQSQPGAEAEREDGPAAELPGRRDKPRPVAAGHGCVPRGGLSAGQLGSRPRHADLLARGSVRTEVEELARTYGELADALGTPTASRAVGLANGRNPVGIIVPCHRVIGANGSLTGYGGGLERKQRLLDFERGAALFA
ncbi:methylated-DNA--[protein]-cysteine S-methyltransferase [Streptomyces sp. NPDC006386]|uniref:methylated-DNA--[protein]-cysteine S-methyltransferase n=1 Tax=Streptomyces sp. NPDC006386 TaxID=3156762 RepID=UPI0033BCB93D